MHFLRRPDAPALLAENRWQRMLGFFQNPDGSQPAWLTPELKQQYREHWDLGVHGACMFYAASPLVPPQPDSSTEDLQDIRGLSLPDEMLHIPVPVHILWGDSDIALQPALLNGLEQWVPQLTVEHLKGCSHWVTHEQPEAVRRALTEFLKQNSS